MEVFTRVKNTFIEFAQAESNRIQHQRRKSLGCQRELMSPGLEDLPSSGSFSSPDNTTTMHDARATGRRSWACGAAASLYAEGGIKEAPGSTWPDARQPEDVHGKQGPAKAAHSAVAIARDPTTRPGHVASVLTQGAAQCAGQASHLKHNAQILATTLPKRQLSGMKAQVCSSPGSTKHPSHWHARTATACMPSCTKQPAEPAASQDLSQQHNCPSGTARSQKKASQRQQQPLKAQSRRWCTFKITAAHPLFHPVPMLIGKGGVNTRRIALQTGAKIRVRGRGSGHLEAATGEEAPAPLMMVVSSARKNTEGYFTALNLSADLLWEMQQAYNTHCADVGIEDEFPAFTAGNMCRFTQEHLARAAHPPSLTHSPKFLSSAFGS